MPLCADAGTLVAVVLADRTYTPRHPLPSLICIRFAAAASNAVLLPKTFSTHPRFPTTTFILEFASIPRSGSAF